MMITVLYEDDDILAVDKPAGIASIPERNRSVESVKAMLEKQLGQKLFVVHRLDKEVSGVMLFAKTAAAHRYLNEAFFNRNVHKTYRALVLGAVKEDKGEIDAPIRQFGSGRMGVDKKKGKPSLTRFEVLERSGACTLLRAFPLTGRRHQIRVHLYHIGHPVAGDPLYGDKNLRKDYSRLMLHAEKIQFKNPGGKKIAIESKTPQELINRQGI
ncbi:MAG: RluA family pseudouridine synthase [Chitinispirillaceae bacterium]|nr:RluA family pseudouridine synthase [Chitinispirillaceae bacterium]